MRATARLGVLPRLQISALGQGAQQGSGHCHETATPIFADRGSGGKTRARHRGFEPLTYGSGARGRARRGLFSAVAVIAVTGAVPGGGGPESAERGGPTGSESAKLRAC